MNIHVDQQGSEFALITRTNHEDFDARLAHAQNEKEIEIEGRLYLVTYVNPKLNAFDEKQVVEASIWFK
jgi:hypothetical protein